jgi:hypothetical protein
MDLLSRPGRLPERHQQIRGPPREGVPPMPFLARGSIWIGPRGEVGFGNPMLRLVLNPEGQVQREIGRRGFVTPLCTAASACWMRCASMIGAAMRRSSARLTRSAPARPVAYCTALRAASARRCAVTPGRTAPYRSGLVWIAAGTEVAPAFRLAALPRKMGSGMHDAGGLVQSPARMVESVLAGQQGRRTARTRRQMKKPIDALYASR